jgi:hypothetical protein
MREFRIETTHYRTGGIDALAQTHIVRLLLPLLASVLPLMKRYAADPNQVDRQFTKLQIIEELAPVLIAVGGLPGEAHDYIVSKAMAKVERLNAAGRWERVWDPKRGVCVDGIDGSDLITIVVTVITGELAAFSALANRLPVAAKIGVMMH